MHINIIDEEDLLNINAIEEAEFEEVLPRDKIPQGGDTQVVESDQSNFFSNEIANSELFSGKLFSTWEE
ncbi:24567_t:CDS:2, partial [Gigaspora rosea]